VSNLNTETRTALTSPKDIQAWLDGLPKANITKSAQLVYSTLAKMNIKDFTPEAWLTALDTIRPTAKYLSDSLRENYLSDRDLQTRKRRGIILLSQAIQKRMATSYHELLSALNPVEDHVRSAAAAHRALSHLTTLLFRYYQLYHTIPDKLWLQINQIYSYAEKHSLTNILVEDEEQKRKSSTIDEIYKTSIMLAMANPYQLRPHDTEKVYQALQGWSHLVEIHGKFLPEDIYIVQLNQDMPPSFQQMESIIEKNKHWRGIYCSLLVAHLAEILAKIDRDDYKSQTHTYSKTLLQHLARSWSALPSRAFPRTSSSGDVKASIGLAATHHFINHGGDVAPDLPSAEGKCQTTKRKMKHKRAINDALELEPINDQRSQQNESAWEKIYANKLESAMGNKPNHSSREKHAYQSHNWTLVNTSPTGYCLCSTDDFPDDIQVGELIGLQEEDHNSPCYWHIGSIRWMKYTKEGELQIGIQLLAHNAIAVGIQSTQQQQMHSDHLRALVLPEIGTSKSPRTIIIPTIPYKTGDNAHILNQSIDSDIQLTECICEGAGYKQYKFETKKDFASEIKFDPE